MTTDVDRQRTPTVEAQPVVITKSRLPPRDLDVESAGDHIAEAIIDLNTRRIAAALRALTQAEEATNRALHAEQRSDAARYALLSTLRGLGAAEHLIQRGAREEAARQLISINKKLDDLN